jgi:hypothetical protein
VLRGRISITDAYLLLGPDVARHWRLLYWLAGREPVRGEATPITASNWELTIDQVVESHFYNEQAAIVFLAEILIAESSHRGDTYPHLVLEHARRTSDPVFRRRQRADLDALTRVLGKRRSLWPAAPPALGAPTAVRLSCPPVRHAANRRGERSSMRQMEPHPRPRAAEAMAAP